MAGYPVVFVDAGGLPVTYGSDENGWPIEEAASGLPVTIVSSGGLPVVEGVGAWWFSDALVDADYLTGRYRYNGTIYPDEASFNTAIGATKSGITRTRAPKVVGSELVVNGGFATDISGWSQTGSGDITISQVAGAMQMVRGAGGINGRPLQALSTGGASRALRFQATPSGNPVALAAANNGGSTVVPATSLGSSGQQTAYGSSGNASPTGQVNINFWPSNTSQTASIDAVSVVEVAPLADHSRDAISRIIDFITPAAASGNKVLWQADCNNELDRVRLVWDGTKHFHLITTVNGTQQSDLDLGLVDVATSGRICLSVAANSVRASLNGTGILIDSSAAHPGLAFDRTGRSFTGETWDGSINRDVTFNRVLTDVEMVGAQYGLQVYGDSTAAGDQDDGGTATQKWFYLLRTSYDPDRPVNNSGTSGETSAQLFARVQADTTHRGWTTIFMDRPNSDAEDWITNIKASVALLTTDRWFVMPPAVSIGAALPDGSATLIGTIQATLLSDPFFTGHTLDASDQSTYLTACADPSNKDGGGLHFSIAGQAMQATTLQTAFTALGW